MLQIVTKFAANGYNSHRSHPINLKLILEPPETPSKISASCSNFKALQQTAKSALFAANQ